MGKNRRAVVSGEEHEAEREQRTGQAQYFGRKMNKPQRDPEALQRKEGGRL